LYVGLTPHVNDDGRNKYITKPSGEAKDPLENVPTMVIVTEPRCSIPARTWHPRTSFGMELELAQVLAGLCWLSPVLACRQWSIIHWLPAC